MYKKWITLHYGLLVSGTLRTITPPCSIPTEAFVHDSDNRARHSANHSLCLDLHLRVYSFTCYKCV